MKTYYQITDFYKFSEIDNYENGCDPDSTQQVSIDYLIQSQDINDLIDKAMSFVGVSDFQNVLLNSCGENGRLDIQVYETEIGEAATQWNIEQWEKGNLTLYHCTYSAQVSLITENDNIDLLSLVNDKSKYAA